LNLKGKPDAKKHLGAPGRLFFSYKVSVMFSFLVLALTALAAYLFVDLASGVYNMLTDWGFNTPEQVALFEDHHRTGTSDHIDWQPLIAGLPVMYLGFRLNLHFLILVGFFGCCAQVPHYYARRRSRRSSCTPWCECCICPSFASS
jgi:hypothetical protein